MGTSIPTSVQRVVFNATHLQFCKHDEPSNALFNHCRVGESERVATFAGVPPLSPLSRHFAAGQQFGRFRVEADNDSNL